MTEKKYLFLLNHYFQIHSKISLLCLQLSYFLLVIQINITIIDRICSNIYSSQISLNYILSFNPTINLKGRKNTVQLTVMKVTLTSNYRKKIKPLTIQSRQPHQINIAYNPTVQKVETALVLLQLNAQHFEWNVLKLPSHPYEIEDTVKILMIFQNN